MEGLSKKITNIEDKVKLLGQEIQSLRAENKKLRQDQERFDGSLFGSQNRSKESTSVGKPTRIRQTAEVKKLKKEIDQYIKEIDKCVDWLQKS